jgi:hypothetical protein
MALQMDIIPVSLGPFCYFNAEDGVVLGDARLRRQLAQSFPDLWQGVQARRAFMRDVLGINLDDSILPLSNIAGWLPPWALDLDTAFIIHKTRGTDTASSTVQSGASKAAPSENVTG